MLCVIPFCHKDGKAAIKLLEWMHELDGQQTRHRCLAVGANGTKDDLAFAVEQAAKKAFVTARMVRAFVYDERGWPRSCNTLFTCAANYIHETLKCPFWWNEADCIPLKSKWLDALEDEYIKAKKPFMGSIVNQPCQHLTGCAIYPDDIGFYNHLMLGTENSIAWDCIEPKLTLPHTHHTDLFHHCWSVPPNTQTVATFPTRNHLKMISSNAVVFHRNKDHTLIDRLREQRNNPQQEPVVEVKPSVDLTVVITSYQRPKHLLAAFKSCVNAGVKNIIVAATGNMQPMRSAFAEIKGPNVTILKDSKITSNQSWLSGVEAANTKYVTILHDDDLLLPDYLALVEPGLKQDAPFLMVQAANHGVPNYIEKDSLTDGWESSSVLLPRLNKKGNLAISPLRGVFLKDDLVKWLRECEKMPANCYLRPGFLVGNDLVIWLKATAKYPKFFNVPSPAVSFGHWEGSTTVDSLGKSDGALFRIYDEARNWNATKQESAMIHILTIVLDGMPFITQHLSVFNRLKIPWEWHIVEGAASNTHCTKWCKPQAGRLSKDGTTEYLDQIKSHPRVHLYRKPQWDGKVEMVNAPMDSIKEECVLLEVDCDEFWTSDQIEGIVKLFNSDRTKTHAMFWCRYFFGPHLVMADRNCYGNSPTQDWKRAWRFKPGDKFIRHEPPILSNESAAFMHEATEAAGLVFDHHGYVNREQVQFKESFYGYKDAVKSWEKLQEVRSGEVKLSDYLPWVNPSISGKVRVVT